MGVFPKLKEWDKNRSSDGKSSQPGTSFNLCIKSTPGQFFTQIFASENWKQLTQQKNTPFSRIILSAWNPERIFVNNLKINICVTLHNDQHSSLWWYENTDIMREKFPPGSHNLQVDHWQCGKQRLHNYKNQFCHSSLSDRQVSHISYLVINQPVWSMIIISSWSSNSFKNWPKNNVVFLLQKTVSGIFFIHVC